MKKKLLTMASLAMLSLGTATTSVASEDICVLTYNSNIWRTLPMEVTNRFPQFQWEEEESGYTTKSDEGLKLWGSDVISANLTGATNTTSLNVLIYDKENSDTLENGDFFTLATSWKTEMDKKMGRKGKVLDKSYAGTSVVQTVAWEFPESVVTLTTIAGKAPEKMFIRMYAKSAAKSVLAKLHKDDPKSSKEDKKAVAKKSSGTNKILKQLKGKTTYLNGSRFSKKNISEETEYYIVYFSASW